MIYIEYYRLEMFELVEAKLELYYFLLNRIPVGGVALGVRLVAVAVSAVTAVVGGWGGDGGAGDGQEDDELPHVVVAAVTAC